MKANENINAQRHWHCLKCGHSSSISSFVCENPSCRADLTLFGEVVEAEAVPAHPEKQEPQEPTTVNATKSIWEDPQTEPSVKVHTAGKEHKQKAETDKAAVKRQKAQAVAEKKAQKKRDKESRKASKSKRWKTLLLLILLVLVIGIVILWLIGSGVIERNIKLPADGNISEGSHVLKAETDDSLVFGGYGNRANYDHITFLDAEKAPEDSWDASQAQDGSVRAWYEYDDGYHLYIASNGGVYAPKDSSWLFRNFEDVETINFNGAFHTENMTSMNGMFSDCNSLITLDLSEFNTSSVTNMDQVFNDCYALTSVNLTGLDTSKVRSMYELFSECNALKKLDLSVFNTSAVTDMKMMFYRCCALEELDISSFDTTGVRNMCLMFSDCETLGHLDVSHFNTANVADMRSMFSNCEKLETLDLSNFDTAKVADMSGMFYGCENLYELNVSSFNTARVTNMREMFHGCKNLLDLDVTSFDTSRVTNMSTMFCECEMLLELDITSFNTANVTDMTRMFEGVSPAFVLHYNTSTFITDNVTKYSGFMPDSFDWKDLFE